VPAIVAAVAMAVSLSSHLAGAAPVAMQLRLTYEMRCGWPGPRIDVVFPSTERLPARVARTAVLVDGRPAAGVTRSGRSLSIMVAPPAGVQCDLIAPGTVRVNLTRAVGLGNPHRPGTYAISARHGALSFRGSFTIRR
jgi:hypothetical protein